MIYDDMVAFYDIDPIPEGPSYPDPGPDLTEGDSLGLVSPVVDLDNMPPEDEHGHGDQ